MSNNPKFHNNIIVANKTYNGYREINQRDNAGAITQKQLQLTITLLTIWEHLTQ